MAMGGGTILYVGNVLLSMCTFGIMLMLQVIVFLLRNVFAPPPLTEYLVR